MSKDDEAYLTHIIDAIEKIKEYTESISYNDFMSNSLRDKLIHAYFGVDLEAVWKTVEIDVHSLKTQIKKIVKGNLK